MTRRPPRRRPPRSKKKYAPLANNDELEKAKQYVQDRKQGTDQSTFYEVIMAERKELAEKLSPDPDRKKAKEISDNLNATLKDVGTKVGDLQGRAGEKLAAFAPVALQQLADEIVFQRGEVAKIDAKVADLKKKQEELGTAYQTQVADHKKAREAAETATTELSKKFDTDRAELNDKVKKAEARVEEEIKAKGDEKAKYEATITDKDKAIAKLTEDNKKVVNLLEKWRPKNLAESAVRRADGQVIQVNRAGPVYINLGKGQQISRGMTFEVYSKEDGMPKGLTPDELLPAGKASIEVVNVGPGSSECHVIRLTAGQTIFEGDMIANLIYDPNVKWAFKVFGEFDVNQDGRASAAETEIVKRLVVDWGGKLTEKVDVDTDFVVLGKEPDVKQLSKDPTPLEQRQNEIEKQKLKEYEDVKNKALELHIPVLSQNRFLYMVGYYDQAKR